MMFIITLGIILGLNIYLPWRLGRLLALKNKVWPQILFAAGLGSGFLSMFLLTKYDNVLVSAYYNLTWTWLGTLIFLSGLMLIFEIVNLIYKLPPRSAGRAMVVLSAALAAYALANAASFKVTPATIPLEGLKDEVKIVQISDVHLGAARGRGYLAGIVEKTNELKPDLVVITGDMADSKAALRGDMFVPLKDLRAPAYFVYGNHDVYVGLEEIIKKMRENNVTVMRNEVLTQGELKLVGLNYMKADDSVYDPHQVTRETIKDILPTLDLSGAEPKVVLQHGPWGLEYLNEQGVALVLAGHTHAGQIFPVSLLAKIRFPYNQGLSEYKGTAIYVSQGAGTFLPRMRLGTQNEINFITLVPGRRPS